MASELNSEALALLQAIQARDDDEVKKLLSEATEDRTGILEWSLGAYSEANMEWQKLPHWTDTWAHKLLHWATVEHVAKPPSANIVQSLIEYGFDPDTRGTDNHTALQLMVRTDSPEAQTITKYLLSKGADPNAQTPPSNLTSLHEAATHGSEKTVKILLDAGADTTLQTSKKLYPKTLAQQKLDVRPGRDGIDGVARYERILELFENVSAPGQEQQASPQDPPPAYQEIRDKTGSAGLVRSRAIG